MAQSLEYFNVLGRSSVNANGVTADWSASGIEFNASYEGAVKVSAVLDSNKSIQFRAFVDGVETGDITFTESSVAVTVPGTATPVKTEKTIRLVRIPYVKDGLATLSEVSLKGSVSTWDEERPLIEFIGDSITCGYGSVSNDDFKDGAKTYSYITANELDADYSMVAISGIGVTASNAQHGDKGMANFYKYTNYYRNTTELYAPTRKADLVVVNLNTNDIYNNATESAYKADLRALISDVRSIHGADVSIVWIIGHMRPASSTVNVWLSEVFAEYENVHIITTTQNQDGGASHPSYASHQETAAQLISYIEQNDLLA